MHLGNGQGSGFSAQSRSFVPSSTLRGALCAAWWRANPRATQAAFDAIVAGFSVSDALAIPSDVSLGTVTSGGISLDLGVCKRCSRTEPALDGKCSRCEAHIEPSKGERPLPAGAEILTHTRVGLSSDEQAQEDRLYERQGLHLSHVPLQALVRQRSDEAAQLCRAGTVIRLGGATSVAGRARVESLQLLGEPRLVLPTGTSRVRVELLTPGVFVDDFGRAQSEPTPTDLRWSLGLSSDAQLRLHAGHTRWTTSGGWHRAANCPKPVDAAVVAHSCFGVAVTVEEVTEVPSIVWNLGARTTEGCGWARLSLMDGDGDA
jgi:hypothetical protein